MIMLVLLVLIRFPASHAEAVLQMHGSRPMGIFAEEVGFNVGKLSSGRQGDFAGDSRSVLEEAATPVTARPFYALKLLEHPGIFSRVRGMSSRALTARDRSSRLVGILLGSAASAVLLIFVLVYYCCTRKPFGRQTRCLGNERYAYSDLETGFVGDFDPQTIGRNGDFLRNGWLLQDGDYDLAAIGDEIADHMSMTQRFRRFVACLVTLAVAFALWMLFGIIAAVVAVFGVGGFCAVLVNQLKQDTEQVGLLVNSCIHPLVCTLSYPVDMRGDLMRILKNTMKLDLDPRGGSCEVHALHNPSRRGYDSKFFLDGVPRPWIAELRDCCPQWERFMECLQSYRVKGVFYYADSNLSRPYAAPAWFVEDFAPAAFSCASGHDVDGRGVILFSVWPGYFSSERCRLEFAFARVLAAKYPRSVYVYTGTDCTEKEGGAGNGYFLTGQEVMPDKPSLPSDIAREWLLV